MKLFSRKLRPGLSIGAQKDFAANFNKMMAILENMEGVGGITITKRGDYFRFSLTGENDAGAGALSGSGMPDGYEEETLNVVTEGGIKQRTVFVKASTKSDVVIPCEANKRLVLQVTESSTGVYKIGLDHVHLADTAWELTIDGDTATCVNCMAMLTTVTVKAAGDLMSLTCDLSGHTDGWLCGVIKGSTKEVSLDFREPTTEMNEEQDEIVFPLYRVIKEDGVWRVAVDVRAMPRIGAYW